MPEATIKFRLPWRSARGPQYRWPKIVVTSEAALTTPHIPSLPPKLST